MIDLVDVAVVIAAELVLLCSFCLVVLFSMRHWRRMPWKILLIIVGIIAALSLLRRRRKP